MNDHHNVGIYSMNVRGLGNSLKRKQVFLWLKNHPGSIFFLQETHSTVNYVNNWRDDWGDDIYFSHGTSNSRGVCILTNNCNLHVVKEFHDNDGRILIRFERSRYKKDFDQKNIETGAKSMMRPWARP